MLQFQVRVTENTNKALTKLHFNSDSHCPVLSPSLKGMAFDEIWYWVVNTRKLSGKLNLIYMGFI
jgi:hypothetical protein